MFTSLHFGLCTAPYAFTKVTCHMVDWWRKQGYKAMMYIDDVAGASHS